jgi:hypothetical protein
LSTRDTWKRGTGTRATAAEARVDAALFRGGPIRVEAIGSLEVQMQPVMHISSLASLKLVVSL